MLEEVYARIRGDALNEAAPRVLKVPGQAEHIQHIVQRDGTLVQVELTPPPRRHVPASLVSLVDLLSECEHSTIWYSRQQIWGHFDDRTRRDVAWIQLTRSSQMLKLAEMEKSRMPFDQKQFVSLLRISLHGCLTHCSGLPGLVRSVKFLSAGVSEASVQLGKSSIGKQLTAELTGSDRLPEAVILDVPVFDGFFSNFRAIIHCALDVDPQLEKFYVIPLPAQLEQAYQAAESAIRNSLDAVLEEKGVAIPVYYGVP